MHALLARIGAVACFITVSTALRLGPRSIDKNRLAKRASPVIGNGFNPTQVQQVQVAIQQACTLAQSGLSNAAEGNSIFAKYFPAGSAATVAGVYNDIIGGDPTNCAETLGQITITPDFQDDAGNLVCVDSKHPVGLWETKPSD
jgi:hypothetical protein